MRINFFSQTKKMCSDTTCIPKCCGEEEVLETQRYLTCVPKNQSLSLHFHSISGEPVTPPAIRVVADVVPNCQEERIPNLLYTIHRDPKQTYHLLPSGKVHEPYPSEEIIYDFKHYCIEYGEVSGVRDQVAVVCSELLSPVFVTKNNIQSIGGMVSAVFLVATIMFHIFIPELHDTQGYCLLSHMVSLLLVFICYFVSYTFAKSLNPTHCIFNGFLFQFSFLATFFWLTIMCFDIWRVIRATVKCIPLSGILNDDARKFRLYCLIGWGGPLLVTVITAIMHNLPEEVTGTTIVTPGFGKESCWFSGDMELLAYLYGIVAVLSVIDLLFVSHCVLMLYQAGNAFRCFTRETSASSFNRHHLMEFWQRFSLFLVMVLCWVTAILAWKIPPRKMWVFTDVLNSLQGIMVFVIFMTGKKKRNLLKNFLVKILPCLQQGESQDQFELNKRAASKQPSGTSYGTQSSDAVPLQTI